MLTSLYRKGTASRVFDLAIIVLLTLATLVMIYPVWYTITISLSSGTLFNTNYYLWPMDFHIGNYRRIIKLPTFLPSYRNTVVYSLTGSFLAVVTTILTAYPLTAHRFPFRKFWMFFITFTMLFSGGLIPMYLQVRRLGLMNTMWALVLPGAVGPYSVILMRTFFQTNVPQELREAAKIDGAGEWSILLRIVAPLSKPIIAVIALFSLVGHWNSFFGAMIYLSDRKRFPYALILRALIEEAEVGDLPPVDEVTQITTLGVQAAGLVVSMVPLFCIYPFLQRYFTKGVLLGSLKG